MGTNFEGSMRTGGQSEGQKIDTDAGLDDFGLARDIGRMMRHLMRHLMVVLLIIGVLATIVLLPRDDFGPTNLLGALLALLSVIGLFLQRSGKIRLVIASVIWGGWLLVSVWIYLVLGVRTPGLYSYPVYIMLAGWMLGRPQALLMSVLSIVNLLTVYWLEASGRLSFNTVRIPFDYLIVTLAVIVLAAVFAVYVSEGFRRQYRRQAELADTLRSRVAELHRAEARAAQLFLSNPLPSMVSRLSDGLIREVNDAWVRELGWSREEIVGKTAMDFGFWQTVEERGKVMDALLLNQKAPLRSMRMRNQRGEERSYLISGELIEFEGEQQVLSTVFDQTQRLQAEEEVRRLNAVLETRVEERTAELKKVIGDLRETQEELLHSEKLASLGSLVAGISHDLNTPIGNTLTVATTLQDKVQEFNVKMRKGELKKSALVDFLNSAEEMADLLVRSCRRAAELVASFKQVAADQASERRRQFDLRELVEDVLVTLRPTFKHHPWVFSCDVPAGIACDSFPGPLGQVLSNLVQNACL
ncbi:MAG TPA: PAS domain S-box protein, partial [Rhodocyclaceae bacterium]|nr:PAS domain S-box protein [Rhodocyclaceae bacterium]